MGGKKIPRHCIYVTPEGFKVRLGAQENRGSRTSIRYKHRTKGNPRAGKTLRNIREWEGNEHGQTYGRITALSSWIYFYLLEDKEQDPSAFKCAVAWDPRFWN